MAQLSENTILVTARSHPIYLETVDHFSRKSLELQTKVIRRYVRDVHNNLPIKSLVDLIHREDTEAIIEMQVDLNIRRSTLVGYEIAVAEKAGLMRDILTLAQAEFEVSASNLMRNKTTEKARRSFLDLVFADQYLVVHAAERLLLEIRTVLKNVDEAKWLVPNINATYKSSNNREV